MIRLTFFSATGLAVAVAMLGAGYAAGRPAASNAGQEAQAIDVASADTLDRGRVEEIVRDYLLKNPEILLEVQQALEAKQKEEQRISQLGVIQDASDQLFRSPADAVVGNPDGKINIVEFYDYNCGFCKRAISDMHALIESNPDLRFVLKEFPILGPDSQKAHIVSQAFHRLMPDKYGEFHDELLGGTGRATEASAMKIAVSLGADEAALREEMKSPEIIDVFTRNYELASRLAITGTPSYVVNDEVVFGALGKDVLSEKIEAAREACGSNAVC